MKINLLLRVFLFFVLLLLGDSVIFAQETEKIYLKKGGTYLFNKDTVFNSNIHLIIEDGVTVLFGASCSATIEGRLSILGEKESPVIIKSKNLAWGRIILKPKSDNISVIKNTVFVDGAISIEKGRVDILHSSFTYYNQRKFDGWPVIFVKESNVNIEQCIIENRLGRFVGEGIVQIGGTADIFNNSLSGFNDAVELTRCGNSNIVGNLIINTYDDAIDINACVDIQIYNNIIKNTEDKGISIGGDYGFNDKISWGKSRNIYIKNNKIRKAKIGIAIKDSTSAILYQNVVDSSQIGIVIKNNSGKAVKLNLFNNVLCGTKKPLSLDYKTSFTRKDNILFYSDEIEQVVFDGYKYYLGNTIRTKPKLVNPIIKINTKLKSIQLDNKIESLLELVQNDSISLSSDIMIEYRGSSSLFFYKRSYSFNTIIANDQSNLISILDLPKSKKWVLYGPYIDRSGVRNAIAYALGKECGIISPSFKIVNLMINNRYEGLYLLMPKINKNEEWFPIEDFQHIGDAVQSSSMIFKMDKLNEKRQGKEIYTSSYQYFIKYYLQYPKKEVLNETDKKSINNYLKEFESLIVDSNKAGLINIESFVNYAIIIELTKNIDGYRNSQYFYKFENNDTVFAGPLWDFNLSLGSYVWNKNNAPIGFVKDLSEEYSKYTPEIWKSLYSNEEFKKEFKERWSELRQTTLSDSSIAHVVVELHGSVEEDITFEYFIKYKYYSAQDELEYILNWLDRRCQWLDENFQDY